MINKKRGLVLAAVLFSTMIALSLISAFGVSSDYWAGNPVSIGQGQSQVVNLTLQNQVGDEDVAAQIIITGGADIASVSNQVFTVKAHSEMKVPVTISLPKDAIIGDTKQVVLEIKTIPSGNTGMVSMGTGSNWKYDVQVVEPKKQPINYLAIVTWALIALIAIILLVLFTRKKPKRARR